ncbi:hypothetical protein [Raineyella sp. W15-4]|uniref:hypothetical protein n=1 Tax=Raineyella sp. W15-4 TaxID=3081651 RepID=UPI002954E021|nr:hypothetical protein [Raineyella sp. W15-4]WOQ15632.1 hypothetical protein R0145_10310 [Raineyella sp. W15-4]
MTTNTTTNTTPVELTEEQAQAVYDQAREQAADWQTRHDTAQAAAVAADTTTTGNIFDILADPTTGTLEEIAAARATAREQAAVAVDVLARARAAETEAGRALLPFATARYEEQAARAEADLAAFRAQYLALIDKIEAMTGTDEAQLRNPDRPFPEARRLETAAFNAHRAAHLCRAAHADGPGLLAAVDAAQSSTSAQNILRSLLGGYAGDTALDVARGTARAAMVSRGSLPTELQPGGVYPLY